MFNTQETANHICIQMVMNAVEVTYYQALEDPDEGYAEVNLIDIMDHLNDQYGAISADDLTDNLAKMNRTWSSSQPLEDLWNQLTAAQAFARHHDPISDMTKVRAAITQLDKSGVFSRTLDIWRTKTQQQQTWAQLQLDFNSADKERLRKITTGDQGYQQTAHKATENITKTITAPTMYYCWSHGLRHNQEHTSKTCTAKMANHKDSATMNNMMGGCNYIRRLRGEQTVWKRKPFVPKEDKENDPSKGNEQ